MLKFTQLTYTKSGTTESVTHHRDVHE